MSLLLQKKAVNIIIQLRSYIGSNIKVSNPNIYNGLSVSHKFNCTKSICLYSTKGNKDGKILEEFSTKKKDMLHRMISKSKLLTKLNSHPNFKNYFDRISQTGTVSTVTGFLLLHELSAIVPLFALWWILYHSNIHDTLVLPEILHNLMEYCSDVMNRFVGDKYPDLDRKRIIFTGALSYMTVKVLYPIRILLSLWAAPYFGNLLVSPFRKLIKLSRKK
ncbi:hypothetical protein TPHA_0C01750 [Tetrapisispora phaffii CBS 4417]|uniref:Uncharacterized protein n=1 Tax=Tetrapisispora phaffii (strain ATCC 24235 / CBS 4417 / NBRC 1672 / NRRL Y-8282 / UCD 70-5) TaxID=1071381 RepID=G8BRF5_TETPH|nr:hypothetical protein TPHA_0C01750 [Tetrapisispora phaffii CBS 4417]CCE62331.1 hypothetical protein TPHA_0C01750 [Tetrapisispora phaffii CBS 4417]